MAFSKAIIYLPVRLRNRHRLHPHEVHTPAYEVLNDAAHDWRLLQYYIFPADSRRQLAEWGLRMVECLALDGRPIAAGDRAPEESELYYVARPS